MKMTNEERQALIDESRSEITRMKRILETGSVAIGWARAYEKEILRHEIVLSALTAEPVEGVNELFTRAAPPAPVKLPSLKQTISGERYTWSDGVYNYQQDVIGILKAAGVVVEVADE